MRTNGCLPNKCPNCGSSKIEISRCLPRKKSESRFFDILNLLKLPRLLDQIDPRKNWGRHYITCKDCGNTSILHVM